ncbi:hypothetical protein CBL_06098 [Carabus blaptoides fortunei]
MLADEHEVTLGKKNVHPLSIHHHLWGFNRVEIKWLSRDVAPLSFPVPWSIELSSVFGVLGVVAVLPTCRDTCTEIKRFYSCSNGINPPRFPRWCSYVLNSTGTLSSRDFVAYARLPYCLAARLKFSAKFISQRRVTINQQREILLRESNPLTPRLEARTGFQSIWLPPRSFSQL